ncbi:MAG: purine-nucleoside phosphorylase, partial [Ruminococcus sp.]|nr:purine-nucleoside phosphorylase [Ruminococcus sp.]
MSTPHNNAKKGDIAKTVLMPGDPLRAKFIAETYLDNAVCYNEVRGMLGFTGTYKGVPVSVQGSGMGMPSIGIYSWELFNEYDVENIIRVGTAGAVADNVELRDVIISMSASTNSNYAAQYRLPGTYAPTASWTLLSAAVRAAE